MAGSGFVDGDREAALADMARRWPRARLVRDDAATTPYARRVFDPAFWRPDTPLRVVMIGTDFEVRVWETLLNVPMGRATTYSDIARKIGNPEAARAVGAAVGRNPISFVVPCHRVLGRSGALTGYHWGLARKQAIIGWEAGRSAPPSLSPAGIFHRRFERLQRLTAPCQALFFLCQFQRVKLQTVSYAGSCRNAVATFVLRPARPLWSRPAGIREWISRDRQSGRGHLDPKTSAV